MGNENALQRFGKNLIISSLLAIFSAIFLLNANGQDVYTELRVAKQFEDDGNWIRACEIYSSLVKRFPDEDKFFKHCIELYTKTKLFDKALDLIEKKRQNNTTDPWLDILAAQIQFHAGNQKEALQTWKKLINNHPKEEPVLIQVAETMKQELLLDQAILVYMEARKQFGKQELFCLNLAQLYEMNNEYGKAIKEMTVFLKKNPTQMNVVESRLMQYPSNEKVVHEIADALYRALEKNTQKLELQRLLVRYQIRFGHYSDAMRNVFSLEEKLDEKTQGEALFQFARDVFSLSEMKYAKEAYLQILERYPRFNLNDQVFWGLSQCDKHLGDFMEATGSLDKLILQYPKSTLIPRALLEKGRLERDQLGLTSRAVETFRQLISQFPSGSENKEAIIELAACYVLCDELKQAETVYFSILIPDFPCEGRLRLRACIGLAEVDYFCGKFENARAQLDSLFQRPLANDEIQDPAVNDGLRFYIFLQSFDKEKREEFLLLAKGALLSRQRKYNEAIKIFSELIFSRKISDPVVAEALYQKGIAFIASEQYHESINSLNTLLTNFSDYLYSERVMERLGWAQERIGKSSEALKVYESFLERFPQSVFANEIRKRIRAIESVMK